QLLERGLLADRVEVGVSRGELAELLPALDRATEVLDRVLLAPREALDARDVVGHARVLGMGFDQLTPAVGGLVVLARLIERMERRPHLPAAGLIRLPRGAAERDDRRARLLGERRPLDAGPDVDERAGRRVYLLAAKLEPRAADLDEVELLFPLVGLVVLVDDPIAGLAARPGV